MPRRTLPLIAAIALSQVLPVADAQQRPDFSGVWKFESGTWQVPPKMPEGKPIPAPSGFEPEITIRHSGQRFSMSRRLGGEIVQVDHVLDGQRTTSRTPGRLCRADAEGTWTASWVGDTVVMTMVGVGREGGAGPPIPNDVKTTVRREGADRIRVDVDFRSGTDRVVRSGLYVRTGDPAPEPANPPGVTVKASIASLAWLAGTWSGKDPANRAEEIWSAPASGAMHGIGRVTREGRLSSFEFLCVAQRYDGLVYLAMPEGRMPPTEFPLTQSGEQRAVFENPAHDYPKKLEYRLIADDVLEIVIAGDAKQRTQTLTLVRTR